jgi:hypothetical protein
MTSKETFFLQCLTVKNRLCADNKVLLTMQIMTAHCKLHLISFLFKPKDEAGRNNLNFMNGIVFQSFLMIELKKEQKN